MAPLIFYVAALTLIFLALYIGARISRARRERVGKNDRGSMGRPAANLVSKPEIVGKWNRGGFHENGVVIRNGGKDGDPHKTKTVVWYHGAWVPESEVPVDRLSIYEKHIKKIGGLNDL